MYPNFVINDDEGFFTYTCTSCGTEVRFGPFTGERNTAEYNQAQAKSQSDVEEMRWSSTQKCPQCEAKRRARQSRK